uniref:Uncharacterized protein n=1 Tax=viral metagenome TaxID=1070528 RepID=A0A6M3J0D5_9ZZZZ
MQRSAELAPRLLWSLVGIACLVLVWLRLARPVQTLGGEPHPEQWAEDPGTPQE